MSQPGEGLIRRMLEEVLNNKNYAILKDVIHPDYVWRGPGQEIHGIDGIRGFVAAYHTAFPDLRVEVEEMFSSGDKVATRITSRGTHQGELNGIPPTGQHVEVTLMAMSRIQDGKIIEEFELIDQLTMLQQLGVIPSG